MVSYKKLLLGTSFAVALTSSAAKGKEPPQAPPEFVEAVFKNYIETITDEAINRANPQELQDYERRIREEIDRLLNEKKANGKVEAIAQFYKYRSGERTAVRTRSPVNSSQPRCISGATADQAKQQIETYKNAISGLISGLGAYGGVATGAIGAVASYLINKAIDNNTFQDEASCTSACVMIPDEISLNDVVIVSEFRDNYDSVYFRRNPDPSAWGVDWALIEGFNEAVVDLAVVPGDPLIERLRRNNCKMKLVCSSLRNWSHTRDRSIRLEVSFDANRVTQNACVDSSMISEVYKPLKIKFMDWERARSMYLQKMPN